MILDNKHKKKVIVSRTRNQQNRFFQFYNKTIDFEGNLVTVEENI